MTNTNGDAVDYGDNPLHVTGIKRCRTDVLIRILFIYFCSVSQDSFIQILT